MPGDSPGVWDDSWGAISSGTALDPKSLAPTARSQHRAAGHVPAGPGPISADAELANTHSHAGTPLFVTAAPTPWEAPSPCKLVLGQLARNSRGSQDHSEWAPGGSLAVSGQELRLLVPRLQGSDAKAGGQHA